MDVAVLESFGLITGRMIKADSILVWIVIVELVLINDCTIESII
jgi:hypothetical protein